MAGHYFWQLPLAAGASKELGILPLIAGASLAGWVTAEDRQLAKAVVEVQPAAGAEAEKVTQAVNQAGFFQVAGLGPGQVVVRARRGEWESPPVRVELTAGAETILKDPLMLLRPRSLEVQVDPPLTPDGQFWRVELWDRDLGRGRMALVARQLCDANGGVRLSRILPQPLAVRVLDGQGQAFYDGEVDAAREEVVFLSLDLLQVEGRVRFAGHPVARASVSFVPLDPSYPPPQALESERDGSFEAWLVPGSYGVAVEAAGFCRRVFPLRVEEPPSLLDLSLDQACGTLVLRFAGRRMQELALLRLGCCPRG
ncbi:MAG: carboxypeptidase-like regulatory domain-containing protein [Thermoanaerobaculum sp.]|nr:carboxypeptidase-like regulatory domain-containing protein [Thermoanaerobaculum sp.]MDW7967864.1 hypothetical protein [Thermoanaerobaculum sp.]